MGGLAGHMSHLYGDRGLKISELTSIIKRVASGDLQYNEKADGQNIFATMDNQGSVYFARNKTDFKNIGRSVEKLSGDFSSNGRIVQAEIFGDGCSAIKEVLQTLSEETKNLIFDDPRMPSTYINCEIIHSSHPNMVLYEKNHIQFHEFNVLGNSDYEEIEGLTILNQKFERFLSEVSGQELTIQSQIKPGATLSFSIDGPRFLPPRTQGSNPEEIELFESQVDQTVMMIEEMAADVGLTVQNTIGDVMVAKIKDEMLPSFGMPNEVIDDISHFLVFQTDAAGNKIRSKRASDSGGIETLKPFKENLAFHIGKEMADKFTLGKYKKFQKGFIGGAVSPLKDIIHQFSLSIVNGAASVIAADPGLASFATKAALGDMTRIRAALEAEYTDQPERLEGYIEKFERELALLGNIEEFAQSMEGVVINYIREDGMPMLYKLTGNFAPANQLLGLSSQGFEIKRELLNKAKAEYQKTPYTPEPDDIPSGSTPLQESIIRNMIRNSIRAKLPTLF